MHYIKLACTNPKKIYQARNMKKRSLFFYYAFLILLLTLSVFGELLPIFHSLESDGQIIAEEIPSFNIEENQLHSEEDSFVYQTESVLFFFDPDQEIDEETIEENIQRLPATLGIGLLNDRFVLNFDGVSQDLSYTQLTRFTEFTPKTFRLILSDLGLFSPIVLIAIFVSLYIATFITAFMDILLLTLFANILAGLMRSSLRFFQTVRMTVLAATLPILLLSLVSILQFSPAYPYELRMIFTLILFGLSIIEMKKEQKEQLEKKKQQDKVNNQNDEA